MLFFNISSCDLTTCGTTTRNFIFVSLLAWLLFLLQFWLTMFAAIWTSFLDYWFSYIINAWNQMWVGLEELLESLIFKLNLKGGAGLKVLLNHENHFIDLEVCEVGIQEVSFFEQFNDLVE